MGFFLRLKFGVNMLNIENVRRIFELRRACLLQRRKDGEYSDRHARADWSLFQEAFTAGYQYAQEEQDSNLTCDQCCNELGMDDGSIRLCGECKENQSNKWVKVKDKEPDMDGYYLIYRGDGEYYHGAIDRAYYTPGNSTGTLIWLIYEDGVDDRVLDDDLYVRAPMPQGETIHDTQMSKM